MFATMGGTTCVKFFDNGSCRRPCDRLLARSSRLVRPKRLTATAKCSPARADAVLALAFRAGDALAHVLEPVHAPLTAVLGRHGPARGYRAWSRIACALHFAGGRR